LKSTCRIVAGANGVGKTTFALEYLPRWGTGSWKFFGRPLARCWRKIGGRIGTPSIGKKANP
jgi:hypothetical protein